MDKERLARINNALRKHRELAAWGNVESKQRVKELLAQKREILSSVQRVNNGW
jgi:hypothetical protein